jgi:Ca2+-binding RTX toxin-like protein
MAIRGTDGDDHLFGTELADLMNGFAGNDELFGKGGNDNMHGDAGNDVLDGGEGNDSLDGGLDDANDSDFLDGGNGIDTVTYAQVQHDMNIDLTFSAQAKVSNGNFDRLVSIENAIGTNFADQLLISQEYT